jgi:anti-sigma factor RsiW
MTPRPSHTGVTSGWAAASKLVEAVLDAKPYITCQQLIDFIAAYRDEELPTNERAEFDRHLAVCPSCQAYLRTYEQTVTLARRAGSESVPEDVPESLIQAILAARKVSNP